MLLEVLEPHQLFLDLVDLAVLVEMEVQPIQFLYLDMADLRVLLAQE
jgi:hypothetical protein